MGRLLKMGRKMVGGVQDDGRRGQRWRTGDTGERAVCFRKQLKCALSGGEIHALRRLARELASASVLVGVRR